MLSMQQKYKAAKNNDPSIVFIGGNSATFSVLPDRGREAALKQPILPDKRFYAKITAKRLEQRFHQISAKNNSLIRRKHTGSELKIQANHQKSEMR